MYTRTLSWLLVPPMLFYRWLSNIISAGTEYILERCRAFVQEMVHRISVFCSRHVSNLHTSSMSFCCTNDAAHFTEKNDAASSPSMKNPPSDARRGRRSLGSWVRIWDSARNTPSTGSNSSSQGHETTPQRIGQNKTTSTSTSSPYSQTSSPLGPSPFPLQVQVYIHHRLPIRKLPTPETVKSHFAHLPFIYQDLADGCLAQATNMAPGPARERRQRMWILSMRLAKRYRGLNIVLSDRFLRSILMRHASIQRPSRFWEKVLDEIEVSPRPSSGSMSSLGKLTIKFPQRANASWSLTRIWILLSVTQSALAVLIAKLLPPSAQTGVMLANAAAYVWSATMQWHMVHSRYVAVKTDEQELHDLMGRV
jgi:hypothetical protein